MQNEDRLREEWERCHGLRGGKLVLAKVALTVLFITVLAVTIAYIGS